MNPIIVAFATTFAAKLGGEIASDTYNLFKQRFTEAYAKHASLDPLKCYRIVAKHSGKCLDVAGERLDNGTNIIQWTWHGGNNQKWYLIPIDAVYWIICSRHSGKCLDVGGWSLKNGANIIQWSILKGNNQLWELIANGDGYYQLKAKHSGKCLDVGGGKVNNGANLIQWTYHGYDHQLWKLETVDE